MNAYSSEKGAVKVGSMVGGMVEVGAVVEVAVGTCPKGETAVAREVGISEDETGVDSTILAKGMQAIITNIPKRPTIALFTVCFIYFPVDYLLSPMRFVTRFQVSVGAAGGRFLCDSLLR